MNLPDTSRLEFDAKAHAYKLDGNLLQGVTSIIDGTSSKSNLIGWAANCAVDYLLEHSKQSEYYRYIDGEEIWQEARTAYAKKRDKAGQKGTDTHALVENHILACIENNGGKPLRFGFTDEISPFRDWAINNVGRFLAAEQRLYSETHKFAGTCDFVYLDKEGKLTIGDLKTFPKMWSADAFIQMGAYSICWHELTGDRPAQSVVVKMCDPNDERIKKYGGKAFAVYPRYALEEDEEMFLTRLSVYRYNQAFVSPKD